MSASTQTNSGTLFIVATPIGNLEDFSTRAIKTLNSVDLIIAEDTRTSRKLAQRFDIKTHISSYHEHNEQRSAPQLIEMLKSGKSIALISDAGTPTISDPGYVLIKSCSEQGIKVSPIPGPCAAIAALSCSGFETNQFLFAGFPPIKKGKKRKFLEKCLDYDMTVIIYESPYKIIKTLEDIVSIDAQREIVIGRELTKIYEENLRGSAQEILAILKERTQIKGEFVLLIRGKEISNTKEN
jgi:16S rRNA (cytidine1402-2'-O)-methyltransferase